MDSGDDRYSTAGVGHDCTLIPGHDCALIDNLLHIADIHSGAHRVALARRLHLSAPVCDPLLASGDERVITTLLRNRSAAIREEALWRLVASSPIRPAVIHALARRRSLLPPRILARLVEVFAAFSLAAEEAGKNRVLGDVALTGSLASGKSRVMGRGGRFAPLLAWREAGIVLRLRGDWPQRWRRHPMRFDKKRSAGLSE